MDIQSNGHRIKIIPNFVSDEDCQIAIDTIDKFYAKGNLQEFNQNMDVLVVPDTAPDGVKIIKKYSDLLLDVHKEFHGWKSSLYTIEGWLSLWESGMSAGVHTDAHDGYEYTIFSSVLYLNDGSEYEGGEIFFPNQGLTYKPNKGDAVIFPSGGIEYIHGVETIFSGKRYTIPMWHTKRPDRASRLFHPGIAESVERMPDKWFDTSGL